MNFYRLSVNSIFCSFGHIKKPPAFKSAVAPEMVEVG
jgi:hypothetical protein